MIARTSHHQLYQPAESLTLQGFPNRLRHDSRWQTEGFAMGHAIPVRTDYTAGEVRRLAQRAKDAAQTRRLLAIAAVLDGTSREEAATIGGMDRPSGFRRRIAGRAAPTAIARLGVRRCRPARQRRSRRRCAPAALDRPAPKQSANSPAARQRRRPDARIGGGEVSSRYLPLRSHSITSSARASKVAGMSRPRAFAVFRLITVSNLLAACTGNSSGLAPLRIRST
jgi:hypothetical protein